MAKARNNSEPPADAAAAIDETVDAVEVGRELVDLGPTWQIPRYRGYRRGGQTIGGFLPIGAGNSHEIHSVTMPIFSLAFDGALSLGLSVREVNTLAGVWYQLVSLATGRLPSELRGFLVRLEDGKFRAMGDEELAMRVGLSRQEWSNAAHQLGYVGGGLLAKAHARVAVPIGYAVESAPVERQLHLFLAGAQVAKSDSSPNERSERSEVRIEKTNERTKRSTEPPKPTEAQRTRADVAERAEARDAAPSPPGSFDSEGEGLTAIETRLAELMKSGQAEAIGLWVRMLQGRLLGDGASFGRVDRQQARDWFLDVFARNREHGYAEVARELGRLLVLAEDVHQRWKAGGIGNAIAYFRTVAGEQGLLPQTARAS